MSQDVDREKVLQTTKVRTSIKSDLSWIQKMKRAAAKDGRESTELTDEETVPSSRQVSYVLMTAKKFESATSPPQSPKELTYLKEPDTSENGLKNGKHSEPVSPEPNTASTTAEEKNEDEPPKSNDSAEIFTKFDVNESCEDAKSESLFVKDIASQDESVASIVPDISVESKLNSPPPQENGNEVSETNTLDILSDSLVEPILNSESHEVSETNALDSLSDTLVEPILNSESHEISETNALDSLSGSLVEPILNSESHEISETNALDSLSDSLVEPILNSETKEAEVDPSTETAADQNSNESAETVPNGKMNTLNDDKPAIEQTCDVEVADLPQDSTASTQTLSSPTKEDIVSSKTTISEVAVVQNDAEPVAVVEVAKEPEVSATSSDADAPQDNSETKETHLTSTNEVLGTASTEVNVQNDVEQPKTFEVAAEELKEPQISATITDVAQDNVDPTESPTTSTKLDIVESGTTNAEVTEQKTDIPAISSDVPVVDSEVLSQGMLSTNGDTSIVVDNTSAQDNVADQSVTEEVLSETKETIVDQKPDDIAQTDEEQKVLEEKIVIDATAVKESPEKTNQVETSVIPEKEIVTDATNDESIAVSETLDVSPKENVEVLNEGEVQTSIETAEVEKSVQSTAECSSQTPALAEMNQDEIFKAEPVVVEYSPESSASEVEEGSPLKSIATVEETSPVVPSVAVENQAVVDISDAPDTVPNSEQSKEEGGTFEITDALDEATVDKAVKGLEELKDSSGEQQTTDNNSSASSVEKEENISQLIMRDGKEVCSHCDQFIGLIKLTVSYPAKYLHPDCLTCGVCTKLLGDLLTPMFEHNHLIYCSDCYDQVYCLI